MDKLKRLLGVAGCGLALGYSTGCVSSTACRGVQAGEFFQRAYVMKMKSGRTMPETDQAFIEKMSELWTEVRRELGLEVLLGEGD